MAQHIEGRYGGSRQLPFLGTGADLLPLAHALYIVIDVPISTFLKDSHRRPPVSLPLWGERGLYRSIDWQPCRHRVSSSRCAAHATAGAIVERSPLMPTMPHVPPLTPVVIPPHPEPSRFLWRPQRLTRVSPLPTGRGIPRLLRCLLMVMHAPCR